MSGVLYISLSVLSGIAILLIAVLGLAIVFGLMRIINMAHGEFIMLGALITVTLTRAADFPLVLSILVATMAMAVLGMIVEWMLVRHLYGKRLLDTLLVTFGLGLIMFQTAVNVFGTSPPGISTPLGSFNVGIYTLSLYRTLLPLFAIALIVGLYFLFTRTKYGLLARAASQNQEVAGYLGVNTKRVHLQTFALGTGIAGLAGGLLAPIVSVTPTLGQAYIGQAFVTVVVGGPAFLTGPIASSVLLGGAQGLVAHQWTSFWGLAILFLIAIVLLRFMPKGITGNSKSQL